MAHRRMGDAAKGRKAAALLELVVFSASSHGLTLWDTISRRLAAEGFAHSLYRSFLLILTRMRKLSPLFLAAMVVLGATAIKAQTAQTLKFGDESFSLSSKDSDVGKIENDFLLPGQTEKDWTQKLVISRFPNAKDVTDFANNLCLAVNNQRPGTGAAVSKLGADCYVAYSTASAMGGQLSMVHRILVDPLGGVRMYVFVQRPQAGKSGSDQPTLSRDDSIHALARLSPLIQVTQ
jgi:hypothetical protein